MDDAIKGPAMNDIHSAKNSQQKSMLKLRIKLLPRKLTCPPKNSGWKTTFLLAFLPVFRDIYGHVSSWGVKKKTRPAAHASRACDTHSVSILSSRQEMEGVFCDFPRCSQTQWTSSARLHTQTSPFMFLEQLVFRQILRSLNTPLKNIGSIQGDRVTTFSLGDSGRTWRKRDNLCVSKWPLQLRKHLQNSEYSRMMSIIVHHNLCKTIHLLDLGVFH